LNIPDIYQSNGYLRIGGGAGWSCQDGGQEPSLPGCKPCLRSVAADL